MKTPGTHLASHRYAVEPLETRVAPANLVWTGDVDGNWGTNNAGNTNWSGDVLPQDGDALLFPLIASNFTNTNNISGLDLLSITIGGVAYAIGGNAITISGGVSDGSTSGVNALNMNITLTQSLNVQVSVGSTHLTLGGVISGASNLTMTKTGSGILLLEDGANSTFTGTTIVQAGTLELAHFGATNAIVGPLIIGDGSGTDTVRLITTNNIANTVPITINSSGILDLANLNETIGPLTLQGGQVTTGTGVLTLNGDVTVNAAPTEAQISGNLSLGGATRTFTLENGVPLDDLVISAVISNGALTKMGGGMLLLSGNSTYTEPTTIFQGVITVSGAIASEVLLRGGLLLGAGTVGAITSQPNGFLVGGIVLGNFASPGILTSGPVDLSQSFLVAELKGTTVGTEYDQLNVLGSVVLADTQFQLDGGFGFTPAIGDSFVIIANDGADAIDGTLRDLPEGAFAPFGSMSLQISYVGGDGNDLVLTAAEPQVTLSSNGRVATYTDLDGDLVTIKTDRGEFTQDDFDLIFTAGPNGVGAVLQRINLSDDGDEFVGAKISVTAKRGPDGGDGFVNVGRLDASNIDLGKVTIGGDLGRINVGDGDAAKPAISSLTVHSLGLLGLSTQGVGGSLSSVIEGKVGKLNVKTSINGASLSVTGGADGDIGSIVIGGSMIGGATTLSGAISAQGDIGTVKIGGDVRGSSGENSGAVIAAGNIGLVQIRGSIIGGVEQGSGSIVSTGGGIKGVTLGGSIFAGATASTPSGMILAQTQLGPVKIAGDVVGRTDNVVIISGGGLATAPDKGIDLAVKSLTVGGSAEFMLLRAGYDVSNGDGINADASIGTVKIGRNLISSSIAAGVDGGFDDKFGTEDDAKFTGMGVRDNPDIASRIAGVTVGGQIQGTPEADSSTDGYGIVAEQIAKLTIGGVKFPVTGDADLLAIGVTGDFFAREDV